MGSIITLTVIFIVYSIYRYYKDRQEETECVYNDDTNKDLYNQAIEQIQENNKGTRDFFLEILTKIGCQYELAEEEGDNRIFFAYQGEHFFVIATNEMQCIHIYDTHWGHVELYNIDEYARLKKAINDSNLNNSVTTVYTVDEAGSNVNVHCKSCILFVPHIPEIENYLRWALNEFFRAHQYVSNEMAKLREKEETAI